MCSWASSPSHIACIGSNKNSLVEKGLANMVANDVTRDDSIAKMTNIVRYRDSSLHLVETDIISLLQHA